ncbi:hypothetical protein [Pusillimonas noertemannii]|uniref:hypothetical protein n=1 Tax=Pusillimonas noertemannii TaxID=305977 RepID=UPI0015D359B8|nr:hypothetical protein [Pusillimonas noertemannii]NYT67189.1 hypothetical protein [Pusillimonas noertemannii]
MKILRQLAIDKIAAAIEADAGYALPSLRESLALAQAKVESFAQVHTSELMVARRRGRPAGSK